MSAVAEFELLFHEILQIMNVEDQILGNKTMVHLETHIQHSLHGSEGAKFHKNVLRVLDIVNAKGNPFEISSVIIPLHNLMTKTVVDDKCRNGTLKVLQIGEKKYLPFRNERYVERSKKITAKISKITPSPFQISTNDNGKDSNEKK